MYNTLDDIFKRLEVYKTFKIGDIEINSPSDGLCIAKINSATKTEVDEAIEKAQHAFLSWRLFPAPKRGELVRIFGNILREYKQPLAELVTLESGKILQEGLGEVQEMIDICDFAVGLSRQLYGLTMPSERPGHIMRETWHPLGPTGIISAFNFPVAVWCWNAAISLVCGNSIIWKPSEKTPLTAIACQHLFSLAAKQFAEQHAAESQFSTIPDHLSSVIQGGRAIGEQLSADTRIPLISATGSCRMGQKVAAAVASRFGKSILELGGNNGLIVCPSADLTMALDATLFGAVGTAGQRCTTTRRLFLHEAIYEKFVANLISCYRKLPIGHPLNKTTLVGPLIDGDAFHQFKQVLEESKKCGATIYGGERVLSHQYPSAYYVSPAIVEMPAGAPMVQEETFAPILYVYPFKQLEEVMLRHNDVPQGLSSAIFTKDVREAELFLSVSGSDCGIANVNIGTSGAEIGGAFGGEKATGGGRESGSDAWKTYMRRQTATINFSAHLPLAQGIQFSVSD